MRCFIGLGSNLGNRLENLESAARALAARLERVSPVYTTPALRPLGAPDEWDIPYKNAVAELTWDSGPEELLGWLKSIERDLGRKAADRWAPRVIDLDILLLGDLLLEREDLSIPHPGIHARAFVLDPLKDLAPTLTLPHGDRTLAALARQHPQHSPLIMGILNATPDSFSERGALFDPDALAARALEMDRAGVQILDIGAESTRPGAHTVSADEEWRRLQPGLCAILQLGRGRQFRPIISVDTTKAEIARRALEAGADWINDVGALDDPEMLSVVREARCGVVIMHHLTVPADSAHVLPPGSDPIAIVRQWALAKLESLDSAGIDTSRVVIDPGIGFGKTAHQSIALLKRLDELSDLPARILVGHSRKSFLKLWGDDPTRRDALTLGASLGLVGADILRVHDAVAHVDAFSAHRELSQS